jgi:hypothetical protein
MNGRATAPSIVSLVVTLLGTVAGFAVAAWHFQAVVNSTRCTGPYVAAIGLGLVLGVAPPVVGAVLAVVGLVRGRGGSLGLPIAALIVSIVVLVLALVVGISAGVFLIAFDDTGQAC